MKRRTGDALLAGLKRSSQDNREATWELRLWSSIHISPQKHQHLRKKSKLWPLDVDDEQEVAEPEEVETVITDPEGEEDVSQDNILSHARTAYT